MILVDFGYDFMNSLVKYLNEKKKIMSKGNISHIRKIMSKGNISHIRKITSKGNISHIRKIMSKGNISHIRKIMPKGSISVTFEEKSRHSEEKCAFIPTLKKGGILSSQKKEYHQKKSNQVTRVLT